MTINFVNFVVPPFTFNRSFKLNFCNLFFLYYFQCIVFILELDVIKRYYTGTRQFQKAMCWSLIFYLQE